MRNVAAAKPLVLLMTLVLLMIFPDSDASFQDQEQEIITTCAVRAKLC